MEERQFPVHSSGLAVQHIHTSTQFGGATGTESWEGQCRSPWMHQQKPMGQSDHWLKIQIIVLHHFHAPCCEDSENHDSVTAGSGGRAVSLERRSGFVSRFRTSVHLNLVPSSSPNDGLVGFPLKAKGSSKGNKARI